MKQAVVFLRGIKAGILTEDENGYTFEYDADYLVSTDAADKKILLVPNCKTVCLSPLIFY